MMGQNLPTALRSRIGRMVRAAAGRDASALVVEMQGPGGDRRGIEPGPVRRLVRVIAERRLTPPFLRHVLREALRRPLRPGVRPALPPALPN